MKITNFVICSCTSERVYNGNSTEVHSGSLWKSPPDTEASSNGHSTGHTNGDVVLSDENKPILEDEIIFHDGWTPTHYE